MDPAMPPSFVLRPRIGAGAGLPTGADVGIPRGTQTSLCPGSRLRPGKGDLEVGVAVGTHSWPSAACLWAQGCLW